MNIKIGDKYKITKDKYQYVLIIYNYGENDKGEQTTHSRRSYHSNLNQIAKQILFDYPSEAKRLEEIEQDFAMCALEIETLLTKSEPDA